MTSFTISARAFRLNVIDEYSRECLMIRGKAEAELVRRHQRADGSVHHPDRSDNGPEFVAEAVRDWISAVSASGLSRWLFK